MSGAVVAVTGPSGAGKDTLIGYARARCGADVVFPRRTITRPSGPGEDHRPLDPEAFERERADGAFAADWAAHGLRYGLPAAIDDEVRAGRVVVVNVSRAALGDLRARYERLVVVRVTASVDVLAARLGSRGRESAADVARRLARPDPSPAEHVDVHLVNDGPIDRAGSELFDLLRRAGARTTHPTPAG